MNVSFDLQSWLKGKEEEWSDKVKEAKKPGGGQNVPDGFYLGNLTSADAGESQSSGRPQIAWGWTVGEGEQIGALLRDYDGLDKEDALVWIARKLARFGIDPAMVKVRDIPAILEALVEWSPQAQLQAITSKKSDFQAIRIKKILYPPPTAGILARIFRTSGGADEAEADGDTPFVPEVPEGSAVPEKGMKIRFQRKVKGKMETLEGVISEDVGEEDTSVTVDVNGKEFEVAMEDPTIEIVAETTPPEPESTGDAAVQQEALTA